MRIIYDFGLYRLAGPLSASSLLWKTLSVSGGGLGLQVALAFGRGL